MSTPTSRHTDWERDLAVALADIARRPGRLTLTAPADGLPATANTADDRRPLQAGDEPEQRESRTTRPRNLGAAFEEDSHRDDLTSTAN